MKNCGACLCPSCEEGHLQKVTGDFVADIGDGQKHTVRNVPMEVCDQCGSQILPLASARLVDAAIARETERLTPNAIREIREQCGLDQTQMSEVLGLGGKTYHRWEKGSQYPNRSLGYYLRVLQEFPEAFAWLRARGWRGKKPSRRESEKHPLVLREKSPPYGAKKG